MRDRLAVLGGAVVGAVVGGVAGYLYLTESGQRLRESLEPRIGELAERADAIRTSARRIQQAGAESLRTLQQVAVRPSAR